MDLHHENTRILVTVLVCVCVFHTDKQFSDTDLGILQFSSILTVSSWRLLQNPQDKGLVPQGSLTPNFKHQLEVQFAPCASDQLAMDQGFHRPPSLGLID